MEKLDKKFYVGRESRQSHDLVKLRKAKDGSEVPEDEYVVFLAQDDAFAATLPTYLANCIRMGSDQTQVSMVRDLMDRVSKWRAAHLDECKVPDANEERVLG